MRNSKKRENSWLDGEGRRGTIDESGKRREFIDRKPFFMGEPGL